MTGKSSSNAFNEVRAILGKLDRSIDEARSKRLEPELPVRREQAPAPATNANVSDLDREIGGGNTPAPKTELQRKGSSFGRAKPLNRGNENDGADRSWKSPGEEDLIG